MKDKGGRSGKKRKRKVDPCGEDDGRTAVSTPRGRRHRQEGAEDSWSADHGSTSTRVEIRAAKTEDRANQRRVKRRKEEGGRSVATLLGASSATTAQRPGLGLQPCTSKVEEYGACDSAGASGVSAEPREGVEKKDTRKKKKGKKRQSSSRRDDDCVDEAKDDVHVDREETVEGVVHEGAMYLVDSRKRVFSSERDDRGEPVQVGVLDEHRGLVLDASPSKDVVAFAAAAVTATIDATAVGNTCNNTQRTAVKSETKPSKKKNKNKKRKRRVESGEASAGGTVGATDGGGEPEDGVKRTASGKSSVPVDKPSKVVDYPFEVEECDHCETSERAYADITPLLRALAGELGKAPEDLAIYDPYYCQGSTVGRLAAMGFPRVYNRKEDFYEMIGNDQVPEHDVLVTNPPFSGDHVSKILRFCARRGAKPWFLLLPNFVYLKDYYEPSLASGSGRGLALPFYLTPPKRYMFYSPQGSRLNIKSSERKTSPFNTFWYIRLGDAAMTSKVLTSFEAALQRSERSPERCCIARTPSQIPYKMMDSNDPRRKKARDRQRSIERIRKKKSAWVST